MVMMGVIIFISLVIVFFYSWEKKEKVADWVTNFLITILAGSLLGVFISLLAGCIVPGKYMLTNMEVLEPMVIGGKEKFLVNIKTEGFLCFTGKQNGIKRHIIALQEEDIEYYKGIRIKEDFRKVFRNKRLGWFFFNSYTNKKVKITLSSKDDIF